MIYIETNVNTIVRLLYDNVIVNVNAAVTLSKMNRGVTFSHLLSVNRTRGHALAGNSSGTAALITFWYLQ